MYRIAKALFLICETPLHAGSGSDLGVIDNPIQRESHTGFPKIEGSSLKGAIREVWEEKQRAEKKAPESVVKQQAINRLFGPENPKAGNESAGALGFSDARLLLFPVKSAKGVWVWITCPEVLSQWERDMKLTNPYFSLTIPASSNSNALVNSSQTLIGQKVVLEEYVFPAVEDNITVKDKPQPKSESEDGAKTENPKEIKLGTWLKENVWATYSNYWKNRLETHLVVLDNAAFSDFVTLHTHVITRNRIDPKTGTVATGALFTEEYLPPDSVLYALAMASPEFKENGGQDENAIMKAFTDAFQHTVFQLGGNATIGKGILRTQML